MIMGLQSYGVTTVIMAPLAVDLCRSSPSELILNLLLARLTWAVAVQQKTSFFQAPVSFSTTSRSYFLSVVAFVLLVFASRWSLPFAGAPKVLAFAHGQYPKAESCLEVVSRLSVVEKCDSASKLWCIIPAEWVTSKSNSKIRRR